MGKLIAAINVTPDGFCDHSSVVADDEHHRFVVELLENSDAVILGRKTFQLFESYWPLVLNDQTVSQSVRDFASLINNIDKVVISKTLRKVEWNNTSILSRIDVDEILNLKQSNKRNTVIFGSPSIFNELTRLKLIDEYFFSIQPMITGRGKRLFENIVLEETQNLMLLHTLTFKSGVVNFHYKTIDDRS